MSSKRPGEGKGGTVVRMLIALAALGIVGGAALKMRAATGGPATATSTKATEHGAMGSLHDFTMKTIDGEDRPLASYKGQVVLVVNTASECGYTPQYEGLQAIHERFQARGFAVTGFPCNDFGGQEPGAEAEIKTFCSTKFGVTFPMFGKVTVKGEAKHPLYQWLTAARGGEVKWNFTKFLVGKDGQVIERFEPAVKPEDPALVAAVEKALGGG